MAKKTITKKNKKGNRIVGTIIRLLSLVLSILLIVLAVVFDFNLFKLGLLPNQYLIPAVIIIAVLALLISLLAIFKAKRKFARYFFFVILIIFCAIYGVGNSYIVKTRDMFERVTEFTDRVANVVSVRVMAKSGYTELKQINNMTVGYCTASDQEGTSKAIEDVSSQIDMNLQEYGDIISMFADLYAGKIDAVIINDGLLGTVPAADESYSLITTDTSVLYQYTYYTQRDKSSQSAAEPVDVTSETFTVFISGNDNYGSISDFSHSDVNMLVTVNPKTGIVLMTSIPRDYYVETKCEGEDACLLGQMDKLTHTGLYGIGTTEETLENLFGIKVNYNVLANFSSLVNFVDAVGGIDVYVEEGMAVKYFYSNSTLEGVHEGWNHLNGERALAFARERHAYSNGDNQRVVNQQTVLSALIKKVCSPAILLKYNNLLDAVGSAFQTNMPPEDIKKLMQFELRTMPDWQFESYQLQGYGDYQLCAALGATAYVTVPYEDSIQAGVNKIKAVYDGKSSTTVEDPYAYLQDEVYAIDTTDEITQAINESSEEDEEDDDEYGYY